MRNNGFQPGFEICPFTLQIKKQQPRTKTRSCFPPDSGSPFFVVNILTIIRMAETFAEKLIVSNYYLTTGQSEVPNII